MKFPYSALNVAILTALAPTAFASENTSTDMIALNPIIVQADQGQIIGQTRYTRADLEKIPNTQKTISEFLKVNSNVQFSNQGQAAATQAEISANDLSIHGALPYNNSFLINGVNFNNDINPYSGPDSVNAVNDLAGGSQAVTINTDLLCNLEVLDSNVSAQYGKFTGGVISATTCAPTTEVGTLHGSINYDYSNSAWNRFNYVDAEEAADFNDSSNIENQKDYTKQGLSLTNYGRLSETLGFNLALSQRQADIQANSQLVDARPYNEERKASNASAELFYDPSENLSFKLGVQHFEDEKLRFTPNVLSEGITQNSNSDAIYFNMEQKFQGLRLKQSINYQEKQNERISASDSQFSWYASEDKNWGTILSTEGMSGSIFSQQKSLEYSANAIFDPREWGKSTHQFNLGAGFNHTEAQWQRPNDFNVYFLPSKFGTDCLKADGSTDFACDASYIPSKKLDGQYSSIRTTNHAGNIDVQQDSWYAFAENRINWNNYLEAVLGVRYDYDSLSKNGNIAPRSAFHYMPFADQRLKFSTGWNRYYDRYLYNFDLQDGINDLQQRATRNDLNADWVNAVKGNSINVDRNQLDLPYADEWLVGISTELNNWRAQLKYVNRDFKDQYYLVRPDPTDLWTRFYTNDKQYSSESVTFDLNNLVPIDALGAKHRFNVAVNYTDTKRDYNNADETELKNYSHVLYNGQLTTPNQLPAADYNTPITARVGWDFSPNRLQGLNISNFLVYKPRFDSITKASIPAAEQINVEGLPVIYAYNDSEVPSVVRWDLRATYTQPFGKNLTGVFGLSVNNVTNRHNKYLNNDYELKSEIGRQFVADISFKY